MTVKVKGKARGGRSASRGGADLPEAMLRRQAEETLDQLGEKAASVLAPVDTARLLHELQVHQIELEMQNEELRRARSEVEAGLEKYYDLYDFAPLGYFTLETDSTIRESNLAGAALFGLDRSRLAGRRLVDLMAPQSREPLTEFLQQVVTAEGAVRAEVTLGTGQQNRQRYLHLEGSTAPAQEGTTRWCRVAATDITGRVHAERERDTLRGELLQAEKMQAIGKLAGGVAHDFNNLLGVILGFADLARERLEPPDPLYSELSEIRAAAQRAAGLTGRLLTMAAKQPVQPRALSLDEAISGSLERLRLHLGEGIELSWRGSDEPWPVLVDREQVHQVLTALAANARATMAGTGQLMISTENVTVVPGSSAHASGTAAGDYVQLSVRDGGPGLDAESLRRVFEPFLSGGDSSLAGLGLSIVYGIVQQSGGFVEADSGPGRGTTLHLYLPRHAGAAPSAEPQLPRAAAVVSGQLILLVDDEPDLLVIVKAMLERLGYRTLTASSSGEALVLAERHAGEIDLLVTDVLMPGMNGLDLAGQLLKLQPELPRLFISGFPSDILARNGVMPPEVEFLQKPFTLDQLAAKVKEALG